MVLSVSATTVFSKPPGEKEPESPDQLLIAPKVQMVSGFV